MTTVLHISDLHFGQPAVPAQVEALEELINEHSYDVIAISGDLSARARSGEFQRARAFIRHAERSSRVIVVPGNHDVAWWRAPLGFGDAGAKYEKYRRYIDEKLEPVMQVGNTTFVGLNTAHGITRRTLTWNVRDLSIIGFLTRRQLEHARRAFEAAPSGNARVIVMHHNPVRGELSQRHGLKNTRRALGAFAEFGVDLVMCGHDHQEAIHYIEHTKKGTVISTAGTVSSRSRGGRPSSANAIRITDDQIEVSSLVWSDATSAYVPGPARCFVR